MIITKSLPVVSNQANYQMRSAAEEAISSAQDYLYDELQKVESLPRCVLLTLAVTGDTVLELIKPLARAVESASLGALFVLAMAFATLDCIFFTGKWQPINRCARGALIFFSDAIQKIVRFAGRALFFPLAIIGQILVIKNVQDENFIIPIGKSFFNESHDIETAELDDDDSSVSSDASSDCNLLQTQVKECFEEMQNELYKELRPSSKDNNSVGIASALPCAIADICIEGVKRLSITAEMSGNIVLFTAITFLTIALTKESLDKENGCIEYVGLIAAIGTCWDKATDALGQLFATIALSPLTITAQTVQILKDPKNVKPCRIAVFSPKHLSELFRKQAKEPIAK